MSCKLFEVPYAERCNAIYTHDEMHSNAESSCTNDSLHVTLSHLQNCLDINPATIKWKGYNNSYLTKNISGYIPLEWLIFFFNTMKCHQTQLTLISLGSVDMLHCIVQPALRRLWGQSFWHRSFIRSKRWHIFHIKANSILLYDNASLCLGFCYRMYGVWISTRTNLDGF